MKSSSTLAFAASIALVSAQGLTYNTTTGVFTCAIPNAAYCATDSLGGNIIIRCNGLIGAPGNCNDNLDAEFPYGVSFAPCFQTTADSGDAACSKNCIIYGASGNYKGPSTVIAGCVPQATPTSSTSSITSTSRPSSTTTTSSHTSSLTSKSSSTTTTSSHTSSLTSNSSSTTTTSSRTSSLTSSSKPSNSSTTTTSTPTSHFITPITYTPPPTLRTLTTAPPRPSGSISSSSPVKNGTTSTFSGSGSGSGTRSATKTPVGPTGTGGPVVFKGAAMGGNYDNHNRACAGLAVVVALWFAMGL